MRTFYNHCTQELYNAAKTSIYKNTWHPDYQSQLLSRVEDALEVGKIIRTSTGSKTVPFVISEVERLINIMSVRD